MILSWGGLPSLVLTHLIYSAGRVGSCTAVPVKVFSTGILKISVVTDKREYRIYHKFIGDRNKISEKI
jgi:hypothetical protein